MRDAYHLVPDVSSPATPRLDDQPQKRFHFHLRHLLGFMFSCAVLAASVHYQLQMLSWLPYSLIIAWFFWFLGVYVIASWHYYFLYGHTPFHRLFDEWQRWRMRHSFRRETNGSDRADSPPQHD